MSKFYIRIFENRKKSRNFTIISADSLDNVAKRLRNSVKNMNNLSRAIDKQDNERVETH